MGCYKDLAAMIEAKGEHDSDLVEWGFEALERSNPKVYREIMEKMEHRAYSITKEQAEAIVRNMRPRGQAWSFEEVKNLVTTKGVTDRWVDWYLVMNMVCNDYYNTAKTYGLQNENDFYFSLAKDFIEDPDAEPHKVAKYFA